MATKDPYSLLDVDIQKYIHLRGWQDLKEIQKLAIAPILEQKQDVIIAAGTASGKTEAAFLPAITKIKQNPQEGILILSISPLKALIDDQTARLQEICQKLKINVTPWHGDVNASSKQKQIKNPSGIILITPESLEALLINKRTWLATALKNLQYIIIDEFHAFIGTNRGIQLLSQLHRIENLIGKSVIRIALSATFNNEIDISRYLRPVNICNIGTTILKTSSGHSSLAVQVKSYHTEYLKENTSKDYSEIVADIFKLCRGKTNLIFANSRENCEKIASMLSKLCEINNVPNEFFPHHALLSKDFRKSLELRLKQNKLPTTVICTSTLELGIDIADVDTIGQIDYTTSVASLRQRLGRSGRRDGQAKLRIFATSNQDPLLTKLALSSFISAAMINLLLKKWNEPTNQQDLYLSTLLQQTLSVITSYGSVSAKTLYNLLCKSGPFNNITKEIFITLLQDMGNNGLIMQMQDGKLCIANEGDRFINHHNFYTSFDTVEEMIVEYNNKIIGRVPKAASRFLETDDKFLLSGQAWKIIFINDKTNLIAVKPTASIAKALDVNANYTQLHAKVAQEVYKLYAQSTQCPLYFSKHSKLIFSEAQKCFKELNLDINNYCVYMENLYITPWLSNMTTRAIYLLLKNENIKSTLYDSIIVIEYCSLATLRYTLIEILNKPKIDVTQLLKKVKSLEMDKNDKFLCRHLQELAYATRNLDIDGAYAFLDKLYKQIKD